MRLYRLAYAFYVNNITVCSRRCFNCRNLSVCCFQILLQIIVVIPRYNLAQTCDFKQYGILTSVDSDELVQPPLSLDIPSSLTVIEYSRNKQRP